MFATVDANIAAAIEIWETDSDTVQVLLLLDRCRT